MAAFDLGLVDGNDWDAAALNAVEAAINAQCPAGTIRATVNAAADTGWLLFNQTVTNAQTLYPVLWAIAPAAWKSGSSLVLPNLANRDLLGAGTTALGATGGANSRTIASGNLPTHTHAIDHDHGSVTSGATSANHTHGFSGTTGNESANHNHQPGDGVPFFTGQSLSGGGSAIATTAGSGTPANFSTTGGVSANHTHGYSGNTGGVSADHTHAVDLPNLTGNSGNGGFANTALDTTPAHLAITWQIRAY